MASNGEVTVEVSDVDIRQLVEILIEAVAQLGEQQAEIIEKLDNLNLNTPDYDIFSDREQD